MFWFIFYLTIHLSQKVKPRVKIDSLIHSFLSVIWTSYVFTKYIPVSYLSVYGLKNFLDYVELNPGVKTSLINYTQHSISYFLADTAGILIRGDVSNIYLFHHFISIIGLSSVYLNTYIGSYAIFLGEIGSLAHHVKRINISNRYGKIFLFLLYFFTYSISRFLMISNVVYYTFHVKKIQDVIPLIITYPLIYQNAIWLIHNLKDIKNKLK